MTKPPRFLERFWSLYLVGRLGAGHTIGYSLLGLLRLAVLGLLLIAVFMLLLWLWPELAGVLLSLAMMVGVAIALTTFLWRLLTGMFP